MEALRRKHLTDQEACQVISSIDWDAPPVPEAIRLGMEWNAEAAKRNWKTSKWYWKMHSFIVVGRMKFTVADFEELDS